MISELKFKERIQLAEQEIEQKRREALAEIERERKQIQQEKERLKGINSIYITRT